MFNAQTHQEPPTGLNKKIKPMSTALKTSLTRAFRPDFIDLMTSLSDD